MSLKSSHLVLKMTDNIKILIVLEYPEIQFLIGLWGGQIRDFDVFSNLADFSRKNGKRYSKTVFFIVFYVYDLVFARKILNHIIIRFS